MARRPAVLSAVLLAASGLPAACGDAGKPAVRESGAPASRAERPRAAGPPSDAEQITRLMERRAQALGRGDASAYAATATGPQRVRDRRVARRTRGLGLRGASLAVSSIVVEDGRAVVRGRSRFALAGLGGRFGGRRRLQAVKTSRGWRVARDTGRRERDPWDLARFSRTRSEHFVILAPAGVVLGDLAATLESGYGALRTVLPSGRLRRRFLVVVAGSGGQAERLTRGIRGVSRLAAITDSDVRETGPARRPARVLSQRLLIVWPVMRRLDGAGRARIVTHELTHAALAGVTSGRTPAWLVEGVALHASGDVRVAEAAAELQGAGPLRLSKLARPDAIARLSGARQGESYALASAAARYLARRFGEDGLLELYESFNDEAIRGDPGERRTTDRALRRTLGISLERLERDLRRWIRASA